MTRTALLSAALLLGSALPFAASAHDQHSHTVARPAPADPQLSVVKIKDGLHVLYGPGGNIGVSSGEDGVVLVDDKFSRNAEEILYRVEQIAGVDAELLFVINTHLHGDHAGSNAEMAEAGALIMAHENVRIRMGTSYENKAFGRTVDAVDEKQWPVVTFTDEASLHFNGLTARAIHTPSAHTDGDSIIHFEEANTIHMGDNFFLGMFPFVDVDSGGNMQGMIDSHDAALALSDDDTVIIPGHGLVTDKAGLQGARDQLQDILNRVRARKDAGDSLEAIIEADPLADLAELDGFITRPAIITAAWRSLGGEI
jgi:glyoxylase-like metal-dependent hydrolase (beta-lactamase superfamily II)